MKISVTKLVAALALGGGLFLIVQSCTESEGKSNSIPKVTDPIPVKVQTLNKTDAEQVIITSGRLTTDDETLLSFKTGGVVSTVLVEEGDRVQKGQVLARLDLTEINAVVLQAKMALEKAERDLERARNLYQDSVATLEQLQNAETAFEVAKQQHNAASFNRNFSEIKAPSSGFVLKKFVNPGQVVGIGDPVLKTNGAGTGEWVLSTGVSDKQWSSIQIGAHAQVKVDAFPDQLFAGKVIRKSGSADPATGAFAIEIRVQSNMKLAAGMFASAQITRTDKITAWNVPFDAVLDANGNDGFVFVTNDNKVALKKPIVIDSFNGESIRVTKGLEGAEAIIVSGSAYLTDKSPITIIK